MMTKEIKILIPLSEYEDLNNEVCELRQEIEQCVHNGKIKVIPVVRYILSDLWTGANSRDIFFNGLIPFMPKDEIDEIQNKEIKRAIIEIHEKTTELTGKCKKINKLEDELRSKSLLQRFKYLFTGVITNES